MGLLFDNALELCFWRQYHSPVVLENALFLGVTSGVVSKTSWNTIEM